MYGQERYHNDCIAQKPIICAALLVIENHVDTLFLSHTLSLHRSLMRILQRLCLILEQRLLLPGESHAQLSFDHHVRLNVHFMPVIVHATYVQLPSAPASRAYSNLQVPKRIRPV